MSSKPPVLQGLFQKYYGLLVALACIFLWIDTGYTFWQHANHPLDGDLVDLVLPAPEIQLVLDDPFGKSALLDGKSYPNTNRYFSHRALFEFMNQVPAWFSNPIQRPYLAGAIAKTIFHVVLLLVLAIASTGTVQFWRLRWLGIACLLTSFMQTNGFQSHMGLVSRSITYAFFYAGPLAILVLTLLPMWLRVVHQKTMKGYRIWYPLVALPLGVMVNLSGPLNPAVVLVLFVTLLFVVLQRKISRKGAYQPFLGWSKTEAIVAGWLVLGAVYSMYLSTYNSYGAEHAAPSLPEAYAKLGIGLFKWLFTKMGFVYLLLLLILNVVLLRNSSNGSWEKARPFLFAIGVFCFFYLLLLPLGGYRDYRPLLIRHDTGLPITFALLLAIGYTTHQLRLTSGWYIGGVALIIIIFTAVDQPEFYRNDCEQNALRQLRSSQEGTAALSCDCPVLSWETIRYPEASKSEAQLLLRWGVIGEERWFYCQDSE